MGLHIELSPTKPLISGAVGSEFPSLYSVRNLIRDTERPLDVSESLQPAHTRLTERGQGAAVYLTRPNLKEISAAITLIK
jgi:hypothetical protein